MEAELFGILKLRPGRYSPEQIVESHRRVRRQILNSSGPDRQRRLDDALIACLMLQDSRKQTELLNRFNRDAEINAKHVRLAARKAAAASDRAANYARPRRKPIAIASAANPPSVKTPSISATGDNAKKFAAMVARSVENGVLRMSARMQLLEKAEFLGLADFKANLIIAEVLHDMSSGWLPAGQDALAGKSDAELKGSYIAQAQSSQRRYGLRIVAAVLAAVAIDLLIFLWLW